MNHSKIMINMNHSEKRIIGSLLLLLGITMLVLGLNSGQIRSVLELIKNLFEPAFAGV